MPKRKCKEKLKFNIKNQKACYYFKLVETELPPWQEKQKVTIQDVSSIKELVVTLPVSFVLKQKLKKNLPQERNDRYGSWNT